MYHRVPRTATSSRGCLSRAFRVRWFTAAESDFVKDSPLCLKKKLLNALSHPEETVLVRHTHMHPPTPFLCYFRLLTLPNNPFQGNHTDPINGWRAWHRWRNYNARLISQSQLMLAEWVQPFAFLFLVQDSAVNQPVILSWVWYSESWATGGNVFLVF